MKYHPIALSLLSRESIATAGSLPLKAGEFVVIDTETTGISPWRGHRLVEVGGVRVSGFDVREGETFTSLIDPEREISEGAFKVNGIEDRLLSGSPGLSSVMPDFLRFIGDSVIVGHRVGFDLTFLLVSAGICGLPPLENPALDTAELSRLLFGWKRRRSLRMIARRTAVPVQARLHRALPDALITARVFVEILKGLRAAGIRTFRDLSSLLGREGASSPLR